jgi:hypothetical protein
MTIVLMGFTVRPDLAGVTSFVRALWLTEASYDALLRNFHSSGICHAKLRELWARLCLRLFERHLVRVNDKIVLVGDGIKVPKEGKRMPAVKSLHQESSSNSKREYIMGHSCQAIGLLVEAVGSFFSVPLACRIHEGLVFSNRDKRTLLDKLVMLLAEVNLGCGCYLVVDAYYASQKILRPLVGMGSHVITRMRTTAVAYFPVLPSRKRSRGRPRKYGRKVFPRPTISLDT